MLPLFPAETQWIITNRAQVCSLAGSFPGAVTEPRFSCLPPNRAKKKVIAPTKVKVKVSSLFRFLSLVCAKSQVTATLNPVFELCICTSAAVTWLYSVFGLEKTTGTAAKIDGSCSWEGNEGSRAQDMPFIPKL